MIPATGAAAVHPTDAGATARAMARALLDAPPVDALRFLPILAEATRLTPDEDIPGTLALAEILNAVGRYTAVLQRLGASARKWNGNDRVAAEQHLARSWLGLGNVRMARKAYETISLLAPSIDMAPTLAALTEMKPSSVQTLFDVFADSFDEKLVGVLGYTIPEILDGILTNLGVGKGLSILDMGCGTGLCAPVLAPRAARLEGCDLSLNMLEKAVARDGYGHLWWADLLDILSSRTDAWDLAVAADVLIYIPDLKPLFTRVATALRPGGHFVFSLLTAGASDVERRADGHYHYSDGYIRRLITASGLSVRDWQDIVSRHENGQPVQGRLVVAVKP